MDHLFAASARIKKALEDGAPLNLMLDFDGTLAPIADRPSNAVLPAKTRILLKALKEKSWCTIAIISGRPLRNLVGKVRIEGIIYGGNHGVELRGPGIDFRAPLLPGTEDVLKAMAQSLDLLAPSIKGLFIENKGGSVSVHYRGVEANRAARVRDQISVAVRPFLSSGLIKIRQGKEVLDITPVSWNKGNAVHWLLEHLSRPNGKDNTMLALYFGDDTTDEDAFGAIIEECGIPIIVGNNDSSRARYHVRGPEEVCTFLSELLDVKRRDGFSRVMDEAGDINRHFGIKGTGGARR